MPKDDAKRKDRGKGRPKKSRATAAATAATAATQEPTVADAMGASSMGPVASRKELPSTREELMELWAEARRRRQSAPLDSEAYIHACEDVARIEVEIAAIERALTPPLV
jgi:hypothetical protein